MCSDCQENCKVDCKECEKTQCSNCDVCKTCPGCKEQCGPDPCENCEDIMKMEQEDNEVSIQTFKDDHLGILSDKEIQAAMKERDVSRANARFMKLLMQKHNKTKPRAKRVYSRPSQQKSIGVETDLMKINSDLSNIMRRYKSSKKQYALNRK